MLIALFAGVDCHSAQGSQWTPRPNHLNTGNTYVLITIRCLLLSLRLLLALLRNGAIWISMSSNHPAPQRSVLPVSTFAMRLISTASPCSPARFIRVLFPRASTSLNAALSGWHGGRFRWGSVLRRGERCWACLLGHLRQPLHGVSVNAY